MHTRYRCQGKASVWTACITALLSAAFIVLIVNRDALAPAQTAHRAQAGFDQGERLIALPLPDIELEVLSSDVETGLTSTQTFGNTEPRRLPLPNVGIDLSPISSPSPPTLTKRKARDLEHLSYSEGLKAGFPDTAARPVTLEDDLEHLSAGGATPLLVSAETPFQTSTDMSPSVAVLERAYRTSLGETQAAAVQTGPGQVHYASTVLRPEPLLRERLQATQARLYLSQLKVAVYEGHSRGALQAAWSEVDTFFSTVYLGTSDLQALEPELTQVRKAVANRTAPRKLILALDALQVALDKRASLQVAKPKASAGPH